MSQFPRIVIAGTNSGVGKTSIALALICALRKRGLKVQPFKVGPDYLDPTYLTIAAGRPCYNLDGWMMGREYVKRLFVQKAETADVSVIEGVMGLFDGSDPVGQEGSTAEIADWLNSPVILVINAHGLSRSVAALVQGYSHFDPNLDVSGVIANQCGSERHGAWIKESLQAHGLPPKVAAIPRGVFPIFPRRHLGLVTADTGFLSPSTLGLLGDLFERFGSVEQIMNIATRAPSLVVSKTKEPNSSLDKTTRLGIARDDAFHFYYQDNLEALGDVQCEMIEFSPIADEALPKELDALYLGGGYPEEHCKELSENKEMLDSIRSFAACGKSIYAECGGLMYLSQGIESLDGNRFGLVGLLPGWTKMLERLKSLGYVEVTLTDNSFFGPAGTNLRGHEFHYSDLVLDPAMDGKWRTVYSMQRRRSDKPVREGYQSGRILASYVHAHFASRPPLASHFVESCRATAKHVGTCHG